MNESTNPTPTPAPAGCGFRWWYTSVILGGLFIGFMAGTLVPSLQDWLAVQVHCPSAESYQRITESGGSVRASAGSSRQVSTTVNSITCQNADGSEGVISNDTRFLTAMVGSSGLGLVGGIVLGLPVAWWLGRTL